MIFFVGRGGVLKDLLSFYHGKRVFVTGHTGFKGAWLCRILADAGAEVTGYALVPSTKPNLYSLAELEDAIHSCIGDVRDLSSLQQAFRQSSPEIVFHLAAQPIVKEGYRDPVGTFGTNVMGTVHLLECVRQSDSVKSVVNVTTDKVYQNKEWVWGYRETDRLDGFDPYSNSKSCSELVSGCYARSFLTDRHVPLSTMRAGNVIGGGDFAPDRILPDCIRSVMSQQEIDVRNPYSVRPYQHVLEPLMAYLLVAKRQMEDAGVAGNYNVGPDACDCITTGELAQLFCAAWGSGARWTHRHKTSALHETNCLRLDHTKIRNVLHWRPRWHVNTAVGKTVAWVKAWANRENVLENMRADILEYLRGEN